MDHSHFWGGNKYLTRLEDIQRHFSYNRVTRGSDFHFIVYWVEVKPLVSTWSIVNCRWCTADTRGNKYWNIWIRILTFMLTKYIHLILETGAYMCFFWVSVLLSCNSESPGWSRRKPCGGEGECALTCNTASSSSDSCCWRTMNSEH